MLPSLEERSGVGFNPWSTQSQMAAPQMLESA